MEGSMSAPPQSIKREPDDESESFDSLEVAMEDLCKALKSEDYKAQAAAFRAAFDLLDSEPHVEGPHKEE
jgi:hypothetical protein